MKVDVHWHFVPDDLLEPLRRAERGLGATIQRDGAGVEWMVTGPNRMRVSPELHDPAAQVAELDRRGIDVAAVSASPTLFYYNLEGERALALHRTFNDRVAEMMQAYPGRFAGLAVVPLQAPGLAVEELERAMLVKGLKGVEIGTNAAGRNLDDPALLPFFQRAAALGAFIFVHPFAPLGGDRLRNYYLNNLIGFPSDTGVAVASLIFGRVYDHAPGLICCFAHGGGAFPALIGRWDHGYRVRAECQAALERPPSAYLPQIYVDSLTHDDGARRRAIEVVGADHMLLGSDLPFDMGDEDPAGTVEKMKGLSDAERSLILGDTAARLLKLG